MRVSVKRDSVASDLAPLTGLKYNILSRLLLLLSDSSSGLLSASTTSLVASLVDTARPLSVAIAPSSPPASASLVAIPADISFLLSDFLDSVYSSLNKLICFLDRI